MLRARLVRPVLAAVPALAVAAALTSAPAAGAPLPAVAPPTLATEVVADSLVVPWDVAFLPDGQMVVTERPGRIRVYASGTPGAALVSTVTVPSVRAEGESGVLGVAVDTDFATNPYVYVCASREYSGSGGWVNEVLRYRVGSSWSGPTVLLTGMRANRTHNGCALEMDDSGHLWVGMGDAGTASRSQDRAGLNGKILRMTRTGAVPTDNPEINGTRDVVYTMGHRNPQGIAIEPGTGRVYSVEHGPNVDDEVNLLQPGGNYGWPCYTGDGNSNARTGCGPASDYLAPHWASGTSTIATSGAAFVSGSQWGEYEGDLFVPTLKEKDLRRFDVDSAGALGAPEILYDGTFGRLRGAVPGPGGQLYLTTSNGNDQVVRLSPTPTSVERVSGPDRYSVAAATSAGTYPSGASEVVVATGAVFPDALAGSAVGGRLGMPVLLTRQTELPESTRIELDRLDPERIWVLGGPASVSGAVVTALADYASTGEVRRIGGPDRYAVAAGVSAEWYDSGASAAFIASGEGFPDALTASPAAALSEAPLLLVRRTSVPSSTGEELKRLAPTKIYLLGGENTISPAAVSAIRHFSSAPIVRLGGRDRYAVSQNVAREFWTTSDAYVASGQVFADGLTGGASAGRRGIPLLLTAGTRVPAATGQQLLRLAPTRVTVVGGPATVTPSTFARLEALTGSP